MCLWHVKKGRILKGWYCGVVIKFYKEKKKCCAPVGAHTYMFTKTQRKFTICQQ